MNGSVAVQIAVIVVLLFFSAVGFPSRRPSVQPTPVPGDSPKGDLLVKVAPVGDALVSADDVDRALWAEVWEKAAEVVEEEGQSAQPVITNTKELRAFTIVALEVAWSRLGNVRPGQYPKLREAVEAFLADPTVLGRDEVLLDAAYRAQYVAACRALAYAGRKRG